MFKTEFIRNLNCNYERLQLEQKPEEKKYQYCILSRGGIKGLLSCSLRYIDEQAYLYYDISSTQNVAQLYEGRSIGRGWIKDFLWSIRQMQVELRRFLLDDHNLILLPQHIFQDLEKNDFYYLYIPYYDGDNGFSQLVEYWVDHIDYEDEALVEFVYKIYEQYELLGSIYLQEQIFEDARILDNTKQETLTERESTAVQKEEQFLSTPMTARKEETYENTAHQKTPHQSIIHQNNLHQEMTVGKKLRFLFDGNRKKQKMARSTIRQEIKERMNGYAVCEDSAYHAEKNNQNEQNEKDCGLENIWKRDYDEEDYGKTVYYEKKEDVDNIIRKLYNKDGGVIEILHSPFLIGKKKGEVDFCLQDTSISRIHARILTDDSGVYMEDLNSTNGTFKNGLLMQPYEKKKLEPGDEIKLGKLIFTASND